MLDPNRIAQHESAAHEKRNWIRLTAQCNNRCTFCLDSDAHNGTNISPMTIKAQIIDGKKKGASRLILSGGEPTIHPNYIEFIALGRKMQYRRIQTVPFGRAFHEGLASLFYDLEEHAEYLTAAFAYSKRPDLHVWLNRFPVQYVEGFETLIQDPYKLNDEVRGRKEEYDELLAHGTPLSCKDPERCRRCYLDKLCGTLDRTIEGLADH